MEFPDVDETTHRTRLGSFARAAFADGPAEIAYHEFSTPIGPLLVAVTHRGLVRIGFETEDGDEVLAGLAAKLSPAIIELPSAVEMVKHQLEDYFVGRLRRFDLAVDRRLLTPYQRRVLAVTEQIPAGEAKTYGEVAALAGNPKAARATGRALGANPIPVVIPCHRVLAADGSLHGYAGGLERKRFLLELERGTNRRL